MRVGRDHAGSGAREARFRRPRALADGREGVYDGGMTAEVYGSCFLSTP